MSQRFTTLVGKSIRAATRLRGGGSAYPGLVIERIDPNFVKRTLAQLPRGVVVVSGTNGKTTTTKMIVELLESTGLRVFTNRTGSNFTRGVASALLGAVDGSGRLHADIAVLELDEAHAVKFVATVKPRYSVLLNVMRDQLDRFGEIDHTAGLLRTIAEHTSEAVILNREDPRIAAIHEYLSGQAVHYFGLNSKLLKLFPSDDQLYGIRTSAAAPTPAEVVLRDFSDDEATYVVRKATYTTEVKLRGAYNLFNAAAALTLALTVLGEDAEPSKLIEALGSIAPAFGRGETLNVGGKPLELVLVKNPSGFRLSLASFKATGYKTMIAINDNYADGRDMSWLWDVDFTSLTDGVDVVSGVRAYDMALRLEYDDVPVDDVTPDLRRALREFLKLRGPKHIYGTYTAMLELRRELARHTTVEAVR